MEGLREAARYERDMRERERDQKHSLVFRFSFLICRLSFVVYDPRETWLGGNVKRRENEMLMYRCTSTARERKSNCHVRFDPRGVSDDHFILSVN